MSHVIVHDVSDIARQRIARQQQIEALPPGPERIARNLWVPWRRPWVHAAYAGTLGARVGPEPVELRALKRAALEQGLPLEEVEALTMDEVLVTPDFASATIAGQTVQVKYGTPRHDGYKSKARQYTPSEITGYASDTFLHNDLLTGQIVTRTTESKRAPIIIEHIIIVEQTDYVTEWLKVTAELEAIGWSYTWVPVEFRGKASECVIPVGYWLTEGDARIKYTISGQYPGPENRGYTLHIGFTWRELQ